MYCAREKGLAPCKPQITTRAPSASEVSDSAQPSAAASSLGLGGLGAWPRPPRAAGFWCRQFPAEHSCPVLAGGPVRHRPSLGVGGPASSRSCCGGACGKGRGGRMWGQRLGKREGHPRGVCASRRPAVPGLVPTLPSWLQAGHHGSEDPRRVSVRM